MSLIIQPKSNDGFQRRRDHRFGQSHRARLRRHGQLPGHRRNLLLPYVTETGVAVMRAGPNEPRYVAVQLFARPRGMKFEFKIENTVATAVPYTLGSDQRAIEGHGTLTLTACMPREIVFSTDVRTGAKGHYETRAGQVFTLKPAGGGGVIVEMTEAGGR